MRRPKSMVSQLNPPLQVKFSINTLMEQVKHVVTKKYEFENRDESIPTANVGTFRKSKFWTKDQKTWFLNWILQRKCQTSDWGLDETNQDDCDGGKRVWLWRWVNVNSTFRIFQTFSSLMQVFQSMVLQSNHPQQVQGFRFNTWWKKSRR